METKNFILLLFLGNYIACVLCNIANNKLQNEGYLKKYDGLRDNFYSETCPSAESIVQKVTLKHVLKNPDLPASLLRLHFHDCFIRGCDASILLNSTANFPAERDDPMNKDVRGFEIIEDIKEEVEKVCGGVVSCADIIALAARDAVSFQYNRELWRVPTGRRDGTISNISEVTINLPSPFRFFIDFTQLFASKGLSVRDLVTLSGAHTIGKAHCYNFDFRLYNFTSAPPKNQDPRLDANYAEYLKTICHDPLDTKSTVVMIPNTTSRSFDNRYFYNLLQHKALFYSDAQLLSNGTLEAKAIVKELLHSRTFFDEFAISMQKMGVVDVKTGTDGQIRRKCSMVN